MFPAVHPNHRTVRTRKKKDGMQAKKEIFERLSLWLNHWN
jgi:hypothetical protein